MCMCAYDRACVHVCLFVHVYASVCVCARVHVIQLTCLRELLELKSEPNILSFKTKLSSK